MFLFVQIDPSLLLKRIHQLSLLCIVSSLPRPRPVICDCMFLSHQTWLIVPCKRVMQIYHRIVCYQSQRVSQCSSALYRVTDQVQVLPKRKAKQFVSSQTTSCDPLADALNLDTLSCYSLSVQLSHQGGCSHNTLDHARLRLDRTGFSWSDSLSHALYDIDIPFSNTGIREQKTHANASTIDQSPLHVHFEFNGVKSELKIAKGYLFISL